MKASGKIISAIIAMMAIMTLSINASAALTAEQVAAKTAALVTNSKGMTASFTVGINGRNVAGKVKTSGNKFMVSVPQMTSWYNGKALYTYNAAANETTVVTPTARELMETNPLLYVQGGKGYRYSFSKTRQNGKYIIDITPETARNGIKKLTVTVNAKTYYPEKIVASMNGGVSTVVVTSFKSGTGGAASEFEYPRNRYPKAEIVDLR